MQNLLRMPVPLGMRWAGSCRENAGMSHLCRSAAGALVAVVEKNVWEMVSSARATFLHVSCLLLVLRSLSC